jgi:hypothetical protein
MESASNCANETSIRMLTDVQIRRELGIIGKRILLGKATDNDRLFLRELDFEHARRNGRRSVQLMPGTDF